METIVNPTTFKPSQMQKAKAVAKATSKLYKDECYIVYNISLNRFFISRYTMPNDAIIIEYLNGVMMDSTF